MVMALEEKFWNNLCFKILNIFRVILSISDDALVVWIILSILKHIFSYCETIKFRTLLFQTFSVEII